tara:strand:+ start:1562 stop:2854 length:1293 start_codon:yes stop_codon:yes gene_type:complete
MAYNFDSEFYPMMVRIEAGPGTIVHFAENSDYEGVFKVEVDSDYIVSLVDDRVANQVGLDSEQVANMVREHSTFTDSDLKVVADLRNEVSALRADADSDSLKVQTLQEKVDNLELSLDSDQTITFGIINRLDSDMVAISALRRDVDSDAARIAIVAGQVDSDGRLLERINQNQEQIAILRSDLDSESFEIRALRADLDSDLFDLSDVVARLDSDEIAIQHVTGRLKVVEDNLDSEITESYNKRAIINTRLQRIEDSDYYDSDAVVRTIELNRITFSDSDILAAAIKKETEGHLAKIVNLETLLGVGATTSSTPLTDSDLNTVEYSQSGVELSTDTKISWYVYSLGGGEIIERSLTIAAGSSFTSVLRTIALTVNSDSVAMNYFDKFVIDYDTGADTDDKIHFRFKSGFEDMTFDAVVESSADNGRLIVTQ